MKKFIIALTLGVAVLITAVSGTYTTQSFINGTAVLIPLPASASSTTIGITTSVTYTNDLGQVVTAGTNAAGITYGAWMRPVRLASNALGDAASYSISLLSAATGPTNTFTLTFQRSWDGTNFDTNTVWSFTTPADLTGAGVSMATNVPTWLVIGASHLRCSGIVFGTNGVGSTNAITALRLNGFAP